MVFYFFKNIIDEPNNWWAISKGEFFVDSWPGETFHESQLALGWTESWCKYLVYLVTVEESHQPSQEQRARYKVLHHFRKNTENLEKGPTKDCPDYYKAMRAIISMNKEEGQNPRLMSHSNRCRDDLDHQKRQWLTWPSHNWNTHVEDKRHTDKWISSSSTTWSHH